MLNISFSISFCNLISFQFVLIEIHISPFALYQPSIAVVLGFIGSKMILDFFGECLLMLLPYLTSNRSYFKSKINIFAFLSTGFHISTEASLAFVATTLSTGVLLSLMNKSDWQNQIKHRGGQKPCIWFVRCKHWPSNHIGRAVNNWYLFDGPKGMTHIQSVAYFFSLNWLKEFFSIQPTELACV